MQKLQHIENLPRPPHHLCFGQPRADANVVELMLEVPAGDELHHEVMAAAFAEVRKRLIPYDSAAPSPLLGRYGAQDGREYQQYFLHDDNQAESGCPFAKLAQAKTPNIEDREQAA